MHRCVCPESSVRRSMCHSLKLLSVLLVLPTHSLVAQPSAKPEDPSAAASRPFFRPGITRHPPLAELNPGPLTRFPTQPALESGETGYMKLIARDLSSLGLDQNLTNC